MGISRSNSGHNAILACVLTAAAALLLAMWAAPARAAATSISISTSASTVAAGKSVRISGTATPATAGEKIILDRKIGGKWRWLRTLHTDGAGAWSTTLRPDSRLIVRARTADSATTSAIRRIGLRPRVAVRQRGTAVPFLGVPIAINVTPRTYSGPAVLHTSGPGRTRRIRLRVRRGKARLRAPIDGVGRFRVTVTVQRTAAHDAGTSGIRVTSRGRTLRRGAKGRDVAALMQRLRELGFLTPRSGRSYNFAASEVALAFQKAYGMQRTYRWGQAEWRRVTRLRHGPRPAHPNATGTWIEVDKSQQILKVVRAGKVRGIIAVSTGATGNTPVGKFRIYQRGGSYLYKFMAFKGNFGIHGYRPVPPYPASHGCVREPMWAATWVWNQTRHGTVVYVDR